MERNNKFLTESFEAVVTNFDKIADEISSARGVEGERNLIDFHDTRVEIPNENGHASNVQVFAELLKKIASNADVNEKSLSPTPCTEDLLEESADKSIEDVIHSHNNGWVKTGEQTAKKTCHQITTTSFLDKLASIETHSVNLVSDAKTDSMMLQDTPTVKDISESTLHRKCETESTTGTKSDRSGILLDEMSEFQKSSTEMPLKPSIVNSSKGFNTSDVVFRTQNPTHVINFEWTLENFPNYLDTVYSEEFCGRGCDKKWQFYILFTEVFNLNDAMLDMYIRRVDDDNSIVSGEFDLGLFNSSGVMLGGWESTAALFTRREKRHSCIQTLRPEKSCLDDAESKTAKLPGGELIIKGVVKFHGCCVVTKELEKPILRR